MKEEKERNTDAEQIAGAEGANRSETQALGKGLQETRPRHHGGAKATPSTWAGKKINNDLHMTGIHRAYLH